MFQRFSEQSRAVIVEALDLAVELKSSTVGVGHLLYGCAEANEETAGRPLREGGITGRSLRHQLARLESPGERMLDHEALRAIGIDYKALRAAVDATFGAGALDNAPDRRVGAPRLRKPPLSAEAKRSLGLAHRVAVELHHTRLLPGHLLLGLLRLDSEVVSGLLAEPGLAVDALCATVLTELSAAPGARGTAA